jgi:hypothetical protein
MDYCHFSLVFIVQNVPLVQIFILVIYGEAYWYEGLKKPTSYNFARVARLLGSIAERLRRTTFPFPVRGIESTKYKPPVSHL